MKFITFLNENKLPEIIDLIKQKCQPFLKEWDGNNFLYRGMKHSFTYDIKKVKDDRQPKDMPLQLHELFDIEFQKKFGWKARSNSVFCTGSQEMTEQYGNLYIIFPCSNYKYISNKKIEDLYMHFNDFKTLTSKLFVKHFDKNHRKMYDNFTELYNEKRDDSYFMKSVELYVKDIVNTYTNKNLNNLIMMGHEIMINCNEYIAIKSNDIDWITLKKDLK